VDISVPHLVRTARRFVGDYHCSCPIVVGSLDRHATISLNGSDFAFVAVERKLPANLNTAQEFIEVCLRLIELLRGCVTDHLKGTLRPAVVVAVIHN
jgi:hypothetical protein